MDTDFQVVPINLICWPIYVQGSNHVEVKSIFSGSPEREGPKTKKKTQGVHNNLYERKHDTQQYLVEFFK